MAMDISSFSRPSVSTFSGESHQSDAETVAFNREHAPDPVSSAGLSSSQFGDKVKALPKPVIRSTTELDLANRVQSLSYYEKELMNKQFVPIGIEGEREEQNSFYGIYLVSVGAYTVSTRRIDTIKRDDLRIAFQNRDETWICYFNKMYRFFTKVEGEYVVARDHQRQQLLVNGPSGLLTPDLIPWDHMARDRKKDTQSSLSPQPHKTSMSKLPSSHHSTGKKEQSHKEKPSTQKINKEAIPLKTGKRGHKSRGETVREEIPTLVSQYKPLVFDVGPDGEIDIELFHIFTREIDPCLGIKERGKSLTLFYGITMSNRKAYKLNTAYRGRYSVQGNPRTGELQVTLPGGAIQFYR
jgi:hypothetical protein